VRVTSTAGWGTTFTLACPLDLTLVRALVFSAAQRLLAVPSAAVECLIRLYPERIYRSQDRSVVTVPTAAAPVPIVSLGRLFGTGAGGLAATERSAVVLAADGRRVAVAATELVSEEELVVRPIPHVDVSVPYLGGAALVGEHVALVLDASALIDAGLALVSTGAAAEPPRATRKRILVVDDSITTRVLHQSVLEEAGYEVATAVDGAAAWRVLEAEGADLVIADVQMPVKDGFALCEAIRRSSRFRELPVVLVTAAESPEHRARGLEAGADAYLGKSSYDQDALLGAIRQLLEGR
jgi:two-component system chemotaxis sensor kinase CheA